MSWCVGKAFIRLDAGGTAEAKEQLTHRLSDPRKLGAKPARLIGIVSDSGVFSDMKEFRRDTAVRDAAECPNRLKSYRKSMAAGQTGKENA